VTASTLLSKVIGMIVIGLASGSHPVNASALRVARPAGPSKSASAAVRREFRERPRGEWEAVGHVLTATDVDGRSVGDVLRRRWRFDTTCGAGSCRTYLLRTSSTGVQSSPLRTRADNYLAEFGNLGSTCEVRPGYYASFGVTFSIWWSKDRSRLIAEEMGGAVDPRCGYYGERIRWVARRVYDGASESAPQVL
jgi:hypothetical protein